MGYKSKVLGAKLEEMEKNYESLRHAIEALEQEDRREIKESMQKMAYELHRGESLLINAAKKAKSDMMEEMAEIQLEYCSKIDRFLEHQIEILNKDSTGCAQERHAEEMSLYAEYAIDLATQTVKYAVFAALKAIDLQMNVQEE